MDDKDQLATAIRGAELVAFVGAIVVAMVMPGLMPRTSTAFYGGDDLPAMLLLALSSLAVFGLGLLAVTKGDVRRVLPGALLGSAICTVSLSLGVVCLRPNLQLVCVAAAALVLTIPGIQIRCRLSILETLIATVPGIVLLTIGGTVFSAMRASS